MSSAATTRPDLREISSLFFRIASSTFGSGSTTMILLADEIQRKGWLPRVQLDTFFTLARVVPGTNVLAFVACVAYAIRGWRGALAALVVVAVPASICTVLLTLGYETWKDTRAGSAFLLAAMSSIVGVILAGAFLLAAPRLGPGTWLRTTVLVGGAALLSAYLSPLTILVLAGAAGIFWPDRTSAQDRS